MLTLEGGLDRDYLLGAAGVLLVLFLVLFFVGDREAASTRRSRTEREPVDAFAGGYPVPPMPAGGAVRGAAAPLAFAGRRTTVPGTSSTSDAHDPAASATVSQEEKS